MKKTLLTKTASIILALLMVVSTLVIVPFTASAAEADLIITTPQQLQDFITNISSTNNYAGKKVVLANDIDMKDYTWVSWQWKQGEDGAFCGTFDGQGHSIKNLSSNTSFYLFRGFDGATVQNFSIVGSTVAVENKAGVLAMWARNNALIKNVYINVTVTSSHQAVGGMIGHAGGSFTVENCVVASTMTPTGSASAFKSWGGFLAQPANGEVVTFKNCAFLGSMGVLASNHGGASFISLNATQGRAGVISVIDCINMGDMDYTNWALEWESTLGVEVINPETFNFANFTSKVEGWTRTGEKEMMPTSVAQMLGKSYTPETPDEQPEVVTPGDRIYDYACMDAPAGLAMSRVLFDGYISGASDTWNLEETQMIADEDEVALKMECPVPKDHIGFTFEVEAAGTYCFAVEYRTPFGAEDQHTIQFSVDNLGKEALYLDYSENLHWVVVTQYLEAGEHTFTVFAPDNRFEIFENGKMLQSCNVRNFKFYQPISTDGFSVVAGASVKMDADASELRYTVRIDKTLYDMLVAAYGEQNLSFGVLFASASDAAKLGVVSKEEFNKEAYNYYDYNKSKLMEDENGYYFYGYWTPSSVDQYDDMMSVGGYIRFKESGQSKYIYTAYNAENDRSIALVASRAIADTKAASEAGYENALTVNGATVYSPYTATEYENLKALAAYN